MSRTFTILALFTVAAACGGKAKPDPKSPALEPAVVSIPSDLPERKLDTSAAKPKSTVIPEAPAAREAELRSSYSVMAAMIAHQDARMLMGLFAPDARLVMPDSTYSGSMTVARAYLSRIQTKTLAGFQRTSVGTRVLDDSTLADSGTFLMTFRRTAKDSTLERGIYATRWRVRPGVGTWVILEDMLNPASATKKKAAK